MGNEPFVAMEKLTDPDCPGAREARSGVFAAYHVMVSDLESKTPLVCNEEKSNIEPRRFTEIFTPAKVVFELLA